MKVNCFDDRKAELELKNCPKIVQDYVKLLKDNSERWKQVSETAIKKLRGQSKIAGCKYPDFEGGIETGLHDLDKDNYCNICGLKIE